jgi:riboflavin kinase/FMN adenylyltransferase
MLGHPFSITGQVIHGQKLGRDLGFPTANLQLLDNKKILPKIGIYAVEILIGNNLYNGMLYIGHRPSIAQAETLSIEVHIFNFSQNIYDQSITLLLKDYIREDQQFDELSDLQAQLQLDQKAAEKILSNQNSNPL